MGSEIEVAQIVVGLALFAAMVYGAARLRAAERAIRRTERAQRAGQSDQRRMLDSLNHAHGSLKVIAMMVEEQGQHLERIALYKAPANDNSSTKKKRG